MADKIKFLTGQLGDLSDTVNRGQVYFAIDGDDKGKIVFDAPIDATTTKRIVMTENADNASHADKADLAEMANKDSSGQQITSTYIKNLSYIDQATDAPKLQPTLGSGEVLAAINVPVASGTSSGIVTMADQRFKGKKIFTSIRVEDVLNYTGIKSASEDADQKVWFSSNSSIGVPVYDEDTFTYNPFTKTLKVTNIEGTASNTIADENGNNIAETYVVDIFQNTSPTGMNFGYVKGDGAIYSGAFPVASVTSSGIVTAANQNFGGVKGFNDGIDLMDNTISNVKNLYFTNSEGGKNNLHYTVGDQYRTIWVDEDGILYYSDSHDKDTVPTTSYQILHTGNASIMDTYLASWEWVNGTTSGPTAIATLSDGQTIAVPAFPVAAGNRSGVVTTGAQTWVGSKTFTDNILFSNPGNTSSRWVQGTIAGNDYWHIGGRGTGANSSYLEFASSGDGNEPIYARQYTGKFATLVRTLTLLDANGDTYIPGALYDKTGNELLSTNYVAMLSGTQEDATYSITGLNQIGTTVPNVINVPINMVGSAITEDKIYLVGTTEQNAKAQNGYSHTKHYIGEDDFLFSNSLKVNYTGGAIVGNTNNYPYHRIASCETTTQSFILLYVFGEICEYGLIQITVGVDDAGDSYGYAEWLVNSLNIGIDDIIIAHYADNGIAYCDVFYCCPGLSANLIVKQIYSGDLDKASQDWILYNSQEVDNTTETDKLTSTSYLSMEDAGIEIRNHAYSRFEFAYEYGCVEYANFADEATKDSAGYNIADTYIRRLSYISDNTQPMLQYRTGNGIDRTINMPVANSSRAGVVTAADQTLAGIKTFNDGIALNNKDITDTKGLYFGNTENGINGVSYKVGTQYRTIWADSEGVLYYSEAHDKGVMPTTNYEILHSGNASIMDTYLASWEWVDGKTSGATATATLSDGQTVVIPALPVAGGTRSGVVTTGAQTWVGSKTFTDNILFSNPGNTSSRWVQGTIAGNDFWRIGGVGTGANSSYLEIASSGDGNEPVYVRQYTGKFATLQRTLTLMDAEGNTSISGSLYDKTGNELLSTNYIASLTSYQGAVNYVITPQNQIGTTLNNTIYVPMNLVGSADTDNKIFLIGTTSQSRNAQIGYSHGNHYIDSDDFLFSNSMKVNYTGGAVIGNTNWYPYHRIASCETTTESSILLYLSKGIYGYGLIQITINVDRDCLLVEWLVRSGNMFRDSIEAAYYIDNGIAYVDVFYCHLAVSHNLIVKQIYSGDLDKVSQDWILYNSQEVDNTTPTDKLTSTSYASLEEAGIEIRNHAYSYSESGWDHGYVNQAGYAEEAGSDSNGNNISSTYISSIEYYNHSTLPRLIYRTGSGRSIINDIPVAGTEYAGMVTAGAQTLSGHKTFDTTITVSPTGSLSPGIIFKPNDGMYSGFILEGYTSNWEFYNINDRLLINCDSSGHLICDDSIWTVNRAPFIADFNVPSLYSLSWIETGGNCGWRSYDHGGGWYMNDSIYMKMWGSKKLFLTNDIIFSGAHNLEWIYGENQQKILITKDYISDTAVFTFQQNEIDLFTIKDNGNILPKGELQFNKVSSCIRIKSASNLTTIFRVLDSNYSEDSDWSGYGFTLSYLGSNTGNDKALVLYSDNQTDVSQVAALKVYQNGNITLAKCLGIGGENTTYQLYVNGNTWLRGSVFMGYNTTHYFGGSGDINVRTMGISNTSATSGLGINLYGGPNRNGAPTNGLFFGGTATFGTLTNTSSTEFGISGEWATYFTQDDYEDRGWIFRRGSTNVAGITGNGTFVSSVGGNGPWDTNKGHVIIDSSAEAGYNMLFRMKSSNGVFTSGSYDGNFILNYTNDSMVAEDWDEVNYSITLLNEDGITTLNKLYCSNMSDNSFDYEYDSDYTLLINGDSTFNGESNCYGNTYWYSGFNTDTYSIRTNGDALLRSGSFAGISDASTAANALYRNAGIVVRESFREGRSDYSTNRAPRIGFVWDGLNGGSIFLNGDGVFYFRRSDGSTKASINANFTGDLSGTASSASMLRNTPSTTYLSAGLQFFYRNIVSTSGTDRFAGLPAVSGYHFLEMKSGSSLSNLVEIAIDSASNNMCLQRVVNGVIAGWKHIWVEGNAVTSAVWNDYAECRQSECTEPGYVLTENGDDTLSKTTSRLQAFAGVSSDTWGFSQGETEKAKTPIAVAGRVLVYTYRDRDEYKPGDCVCAAPGGTVDIMTRDEVLMNPDRIVGTVSCVPDYEEWGGGENADRDPVKVNGRIWIKVK